MLAQRANGAGRMFLTRLTSRWGAALLGAALVLGGSVASSATPDAAAPAAPEAGVASTDGSPTSLALAMPIVVPQRTDGLISPEELEEYTAPTGVLSRQLDAVANRPVALGIDPMIIASIRILGTTAPATATAWLQRLETVTNETFSLAWADADVAALSQAGLTDLSVPTSFPIDASRFEAPVDAPSPSASPSVSPTTSTDAVPETDPVPSGEELVSLPFSLPPMLWPRDDTVVTSDLGVFSAAGPVTTILDSGNVAYQRDAIPASATAGGHSVLVSNNDISSFLREAASAPSDAAFTSSIAQLTATLAGWTAGSATVLATFDRDIPTSLNRISATIAVLETTPGIVLTSIERTLGEEPVAIGIVDLPVPAERVAGVQSMLQTEPATTAFAGVLDDQSLITGEQRRRMLALASNAWVDVSTWPSAVTDFTTAATALLGSVHVLESSQINLLSDTGNIPVTIANSLPYPVTVSVHVWANRAVLDVLEDSVTVTIEAESQARAAVPVQSIANGDALLVVTLTSPTGVAIGSPLYINTNVQAGWETVFTTVVAGVVLLVFLVGVARTVARRRRQRREAEAA